MSRRCRDCSRSVSPGLLPNPVRVSAQRAIRGSCRQAGAAVQGGGDRGAAVAVPGYRDRRYPPQLGLACRDRRPPPVRAVSCLRTPFRRQRCRARSIWITRRPARLPGRPKAFLATAGRKQLAQPRMTWSSLVSTYRGPGCDARRVRARSPAFSDRAGRSPMTVQARRLAFPACSAAGCRTPGNWASRSSGPRGSWPPRTGAPAWPARGRSARAAPPGPARCRRQDGEVARIADDPPVRQSLAAAVARLLGAGICPPVFHGPVRCSSRAPRTMLKISGDRMPRRTPGLIT
jgi:hypothetical protein